MLVFHRIARRIAPDRPTTRQGREPDRIPVVDDDPLTLRHVRDTLTEAGYSPLITGNHSDLAEIIRTEKPALILLTWAINFDPA